MIAYNEEKALDSLFKDIIAQDYPHGNIEVILVNAMSTDQTRRKMEHFSEEDHGFRRVVVLDNAKKIQAAGWNVAITASKGDIILRIDAHTMIPHDFVSKNVQCILSGENVTGGRRPNVVEEETPWKHTLLLAESSMFGSSIAPYRKGNHKTYVKSVFHGAYRKEVFEKAGLFNENLGRTEDNEMHYRIRKAGYKICFNPDIISYQNIRNSWCGMLKQKIWKWALDWLDAWSLSGMLFYSSFCSFGICVCTDFNRNYSIVGKHRNACLLMHTICDCRFVNVSVSCSKAKVVQLLFDVAINISITASSIWSRNLNWNYRNAILGKED